MPKSVEFHVPMIPTAKGRPRACRMGAFVRLRLDAKDEQAEIQFVAFAAPHAPPEPFAEGVEAYIDFRFPPPKGWPRWRAVRPADTPHVSRPDLDNLAKLVLDALNRTGHFWRDDAQVTTLTVSKGYADPPRRPLGTTVCLYPLEGPTPPMRRSKNAERAGA